MKDGFYYGILGDFLCKKRTVVGALAVISVEETTGLQVS